MCGIVHVKRKDGKDALKMTWKRYVSQKNRGTQGFGYVAVRKNKVISIGRDAQEKGIDEALHKEVDIDEVLFHHRYPTSTPNFAEATHPILISHKMLDYHYLVAHNGVITNDTILKEKYDAMGFQFTTLIRHEYITRDTTYFDEQFNDSEVFGIDLALTLEKFQEKIESEGNIAFIAYQLDKRNHTVLKTFWGRNNGNPLMIDDNKSFLSITSEGSGKVVIADMLFCLDHMTDIQSHIDLKIGRSYQDYYAKNAYKYKKDEDYEDYPEYHGKHKATDPANLLGFGGGFNGEEDDENMDIPEVDILKLLEDREKYLSKEDYDLFYSETSLHIKPEHFTEGMAIKFYEERAYIEDEMIVAMNTDNYDYGNALDQLLNMLNERIEIFEDYWRGLELDEALTRGSVPSTYVIDEVGRIVEEAKEVLNNKEDKF